MINDKTYFVVILCIYILHRMLEITPIQNVYNYKIIYIKRFFLKLFICFIKYYLFLCELTLNFNQFKLVKFVFLAY